MTLDSRCCAKIWPKEGPTKCFVGEIRGAKNEAEESAMEKFWQDPDVRKTAATLPPSNRQKDRIRSVARYKDKQRANNQLRHHARLEQRGAESALRWTNWTNRTRRTCFTAPAAARLSVWSNPWAVLVTQKINQQSQSCNLLLVQWRIRWVSACKSEKTTIRLPVSSMTGLQHLCRRTLGSEWNPSVLHWIGHVCGGTLVSEWNPSVSQSAAGQYCAPGGGGGMKSSIWEYRGFCMILLVG